MSHRQTKQQDSLQVMTSFMCEVKAKLKVVYIWNAVLEPAYMNQQQLVFH